MRINYTDFAIRDSRLKNYARNVSLSPRVVKITVTVNLRKKLQYIAEVVYLEDIVTTLGAQILLNVTLGAFEWESEISCVCCYSLKLEKIIKRVPRGTTRTPEDTSGIA